MDIERSTRLLEWITALESTDSGRLMLTNVLFAFRKERPSGNILRELLFAVCERWSIDGGNSADAIVELIADELLASALCAAPRVPCTRCSMVIDAVSLVTHNIRHKELGFGIGNEVPPRLLAMLEHGIPEGFAKGDIRGRRALAWVTRTEDLERLRQQHTDANQLATVIRDRLGLSHRDHDELLLEIEYPAELVGNIKCVAPTFLEGGAGLIFRACACDDEWGRAVDLETLADGLPEAVHRPVAFSSQFQVRRIGRPTTDPGFTFADVVDRAEYPWRSMPEDFQAFVDRCTGTGG